MHGAELVLTIGYPAIPSIVIVLLKTLRQITLGVRLVRQGSDFCQPFLPSRGFSAHLITRSLDVFGDSGVVTPDQGYELRTPLLLLLCCSYDFVIVQC